MGDLQYLTVIGDIRFKCVILVGFECLGECVQGCVWGLRVYLGVSGQVWDFLMGVLRGVLNNKFRQLISNFVII